MKKYFPVQFLALIIISLFVLGGCKKDKDDTVTPVSPDRGAKWRLPVR